MPENRHVPSVFLTKWRGEAHGLEDLRMMPSWSNLSNSDLAAWSFSGLRGLGLKCTGRPFVSMACSIAVGDAIS